MEYKNKSKVYEIVAVECGKHAGETRNFGRTDDIESAKEYYSMLGWRTEPNDSEPYTYFVEEGADSK